MRTRIWAPIAGAGVVVALAVAALAAPVAQAATHIIHSGRGGVFFVTDPGPASAGSVIAGIAISAAVIAGVVYFGLWADRTGRARLQAVPDAADARSEAASEERERKAA